MTRPVPRRSSGSAAWRCATGCSCTARRTGPRRCATKKGEMKVASGRKPTLRASTVDRVPGLRGVTKMGEAFAVIPLVKRALPEAKLPMQDVRTLGAMARRRPSRGARCAGSRAARRSRARPASRGDQPAAGDRSLCAAAISPPTTVSSTRRSPRTSRTARPPTRPRSTTAAARTWSRRCSRRRRAGNVAVRKRRASAARPPRAWSRSASMAVAVEVFALVRAPLGDDAREGAAAPGLRDPAAGRARASRPRSSSRSGRRRWPRSCAGRRARLGSRPHFRPSGHLFVTLFAPVADN